MTLEEFNRMVTEASQKAHIFVSESFGSSAKRVRSVALRIDDDGVLSIILYQERMKSRVPTDESARMEAAIDALRNLVKREPALKDSFDEFDGFFVHWNEILDAMAAAGDDYTGYCDSPLELIARLIDERDELLAKVDETKQPEIVEKQNDP